MTIEQLINELKKHNKNTKVVLSSDEELNNLYDEVEVSKLEGILTPSLNDSGHEIRDENGQVVLDNPVVIWGYGNYKY